MTGAHAEESSKTYRAFRSFDFKDNTVIQVHEPSRIMDTLRNFEIWVSC